MNVGWSVVEVGKMGSDQLLYGTEGSEGLGGLDVVTSEVPLHSPPRISVLADDGPRLDEPRGTEISVHLETDELPFQRPNPQALPSASVTRTWRAAIADVDKRPLAALGVAVILVVVFAAFISRNGRTLTGDDEATEQPSAVDSASAAATADPLAGTPAQAELGSDPFPAGDEPGDPSARSTGTVRPGEGSEFFSGQIVEPDRSLTGTDVDWTPTTVAPSTTATTPSTAATSSSAQDSTTTTTVPSTSTTAATAAPSGPWVRAIGPGAADEQNATIVGSGRLTLEAEGSNENMRYRFFVFVKTDDGEWRQVERSRWRSKPNWKIDVDRYDGRVLRWTVIGVTGFRNRTDESAPLHIRVGEGAGDDSGGGGDTETDE